MARARVGFGLKATLVAMIGILEYKMSAPMVRSNNAQEMRSVPNHATIWSWSLRIKEY